MSDDELLAEYSRRHTHTLVHLATKLTSFLQERVDGIKHIDRISARAKDPTRFIAKAKKEYQGKRKYSDPLSEIQDQLAARIIVFYLSDVEIVESTIKRYLNSIETNTIIPDSPKQFGYEGTHLIFSIPEELLEDEDHPDVPDFFELQIKTLFQHAWSEAEHDLSYKPPTPLTSHQAREIAFTAAQAWGADQMFSKLSKELMDKK